MPTSRLVFFPCTIGAWKNRPTVVFWLQLFMAMQTERGGLNHFGKRGSDPSTVPPPLVCDAITAPTCVGRTPYAGSNRKRDK